jgi:hypothetical protein
MTLSFDAEFSLDSSRDFEGQSSDLPRGQSVSRAGRVVEIGVLGNSLLQEKRAAHVDVASVTSLEGLLELGVIAAVNHSAGRFATSRDNSSHLLSS